jgi:hypothetical protein
MVDVEEAVAVEDVVAEVEGGELPGVVMLQFEFCFGVVMTHNCLFFPKLWIS